MARYPLYSTLFLAARDDGKNHEAVEKFVQYTQFRAGARRSCAITDWCRTPTRRIWSPSKANASPRSMRSMHPGTSLAATASDNAGVGAECHGGLPGAHAAELGRDAGSQGSRRARGGRKSGQEKAARISWPEPRWRTLSNRMRIRAITLDLDDTLWPIEPVMLRAEQRLDAWLQAHCPPVAAALSDRRRCARCAIASPRKIPTSRMTSPPSACCACARRCSRTAMASSTSTAAFAEFYAARNEVECYSDALPALERLAARFPLVSLSNGNADLERIGLAHFFHFSISSRNFGKAKPAVGDLPCRLRRARSAAGRGAACRRRSALDVLGASAAGLRSAWLNRNVRRPGRSRPSAGLDRARPGRTGDDALEACRTAA